MQHPRVATVDYIISIDLYTVFANLLDVITFLHSMLLDVEVSCCVTVTPMLSLACRCS